MRKEITHPNRWQAKVLLDNHPVIILLTSRQIGKSISLLQHAYRQALNPGSEILYATNTISQAKESFFNRLSDPSNPVFHPSWIKSINHTERFISLKNNSRVSAVGIDNMEALRGRSGVDLLLLDEFQDFTKDALSVLIPMMLAAKDLKIIKAGTAKHSHNILFQEYLNAENDPMISTYRLPITDFIDDDTCPYINEEKILFLKNNMSEQQFASEFLTQPMETTGLVFPKFSHEHIKSVDFTKQPRLHIGIDFNIDRMSAVVCHYDHQTKILYVLDEIYQTHENSNITSMLKEIKAKYGKQNVFICPDRSAGARNATIQDPTATGIQNIRKEGFNVLIPKSNPPIYDSVELINTKICNANNDIRFFVDPKCTNLINCMNLLMWTTPSSYDKKNDLDHLPDALRYAVFQIFRNRNTVKVTHF